MKERPEIRPPRGKLGVLLPGQFLTGVDDGTLAILTEHALLNTLYDWNTFNDAGYNLHLAINVPVSALLRLPVPTLVKENRPQDARWPGLVVEVKEDQIVRDIKLAQEIARQLKVSGVTVAIDDFGGGYSSFASLRELPFAELKIDRDADRNRRLQKLARRECVHANCPRVYRAAAQAAAIRPTQRRKPRSRMPGIADSYHARDAPRVCRSAWRQARVFTTA